MKLTLAEPNAMARAATAKHPTAAAQPHEAVDPTVYEGWDFDRVNREARRLRRLERGKGHDAVVAAGDGQAVAVGHAHR